MVAVVGKLFVQRDAELLMRFRGGDRILKVAGVGGALAPKIEPRLRILMREQRIIPGNVFEALEFDRGPCPRLPCIGRYGMGWGPESEQVDHHELAVMFPARAEESGLRVPAHGERSAAI